MVLAGPNPIADSEDPGTAGFSGSVVVAEFDSLEAAKAWAEADPYIEAGVYANVDVKPFKKGAALTMRIIALVLTLISTPVWATGGLDH